MKEQKFSTAIRSNMDLILKEQISLSEKIDYTQVAAFIPYIYSADRLFLTAAGRSGLALKAAAMRLMHFGLKVFVVGEITTPAIGPGDLLIVASGSGTTVSILTTAEKGIKAGATVLAFSTTLDAPLAKLASHTIILPAAQKEDHGKSISVQYAGSLFEQGLWLLTDAIFQTMWEEKPVPAEELWKRHANLE